jgi:hypothetical protein|tara:strand:+ start:82 stop:501 length:420 start_codon:yes stop_codon:yes gene_type:complete
VAHNYDINEGIYPGDPGYVEWTGFEKQKSIPGTTSKTAKIIHPLTFHSKLLKLNKLNLRPNLCYTDFKIRCHIELAKNKKWFQPKEWGPDKLLYNYDLLFYLHSQNIKVDTDLIDLLKDHIDFIYKKYKVNIKDRIPND